MHYQIKAKEVFMNFFAALLTYLFFSHPKVLLLLALLVAIFYFMISCPDAGFIILSIIAIGVCFWNMIGKL